MNHYVVNFPKVPIKFLWQKIKSCMHYWHISISFHAAHFLISQWGRYWST